jgi:hypothetical protein
VVLRFYLYLCGESCLLVSWCAASRCGMEGSNEDPDKSRRPDAEDWDDQAQVGYSVAGRSGGRMMSCVICTMHMEMRSTSFLVEPQNQGRRFPDLGLKTDSSNLMILASKSPRRFFRLCLKTKQTSFCWLHRKIDGGRTA